MMEIGSLSSDPSKVSRDSSVPSINPRPKKRQKERIEFGDDNGERHQQQPDDLLLNSPFSSKIPSGIIMVSKERRSRGGDTFDYDDIDDGSLFSDKSTITGISSLQESTTNNSVNNVVTQTKELISREWNEFEEQFAAAANEISDDDDSDSIQSEMKRLKELENRLSWELREAAIMAMGGGKAEKEKNKKNTREENNSTGGWENHSINKGGGRAEKEKNKKKTSEDNNSTGGGGNHSVNKAVEQTKEFISRQWNEFEQFASKDSCDDASSSGFQSIQSEMKRLKDLEKSLRRELGEASLAMSSARKKSITSAKDLAGNNNNNNQRKESCEQQRHDAEKEVNGELNIQCGGRSSVACSASEVATSNTAGPHFVSLASSTVDCLEQGEEKATEAAVEQKHSTDDPSKFEGTVQDCDIKDDKKTEGQSILSSFPSRPSPISPASPGANHNANKKDVSVPYEARGTYSSSHRCSSSSVTAKSTKSPKTPDAPCLKRALPSSPTEGARSVTEPPSEEETIESLSSSTLDAAHITEVTSQGSNGLAEVDRSSPRPCLPCSRSFVSLSTRNAESTRQTDKSRNVIRCRPCSRSCSPGRTTSRWRFLSADIEANGSAFSAIAVVERQAEVKEQTSLTSRVSSPCLFSVEHRHSPPQTKAVGSPSVVISPDVPRLESTFCSSPSDSARPETPDDKSEAVPSDGIDQSASAQIENCECTSAESCREETPHRPANVMVGSGPDSDPEENSIASQQERDEANASDAFAESQKSAPESFGSRIRAVLSYFPSSSSTTSSISSCGAGVIPEVTKVRTGNADPPICSAVSVTSETMFAIGTIPTQKPTSGFFGKVGVVQVFDRSNSSLPQPSSAVVKTTSIRDSPPETSYSRPSDSAPPPCTPDTEDSATSSDVVSNQIPKQNADLADDSENHDTRSKDEQSLSSKVGRMANFVLNLALKRDTNDESKNLLRLHQSEEHPDEITNSQTNGGKLELQITCPGSVSCKEADKLGNDENGIRDAGSVISEITGAEGSVTIREWEGETSLAGKPDSSDRHGQSSSQAANKNNKNIYGPDVPCPRSAPSATGDAGAVVSTNADSQVPYQVSNENGHELESFGPTLRWHGIVPRDLFEAKFGETTKPIPHLGPHGSESSVEVSEDFVSSSQRECADATEIVEGSRQIASRRSLTNTSSLFADDVEKLDRQTAVSTLSFSVANKEYICSSGKPVVIWVMLSAISRLLYGETVYNVTAFGSQRVVSRSFQGTLCVFLASVNILYRVFNSSEFAPTSILLAASIFAWLEVKTPHSVDESRLAFVACLGGVALLRGI